MRNTQLQSAGFTLFELMLVIAVMGIVLGLGVPAFNRMITNNKIVAKSNELVAALTLARSESIKRGLPVSVCAAADAACTEDTDWSQGWIVFTDDTGTTGVMDDDDELLQEFAIPTGEMTIAGDDAFVGYLPTGARSKRVLTVEKSGCTGDNKRQITIELTGRVNIAKQACS